MNVFPTECLKKKETYVVIISQLFHNQQTFHFRINGLYLIVQSGQTPGPHSIGQTLLDPQMPTQSVPFLTDLASAALIQGYLV